MKKIGRSKVVVFLLFEKYICNDFPFFKFFYVFRNKFVFSDFYFSAEWSICTVKWNVRLLIILNMTYKST